MNGEGEKGGEKGGGGAGDVINALKFAWEVVKDGKPVVNISSDKANAVPSGVDWRKLDFVGPNTQPISFVTYHPDGYIKATDVEMTLRWDYGAQWENQYFLNNVGITVESADIAWFSTVDITVSVGNPEMRHSLAYLPITVRARDNNIIKSFTYGVWGNGDGKQI